MGDEGGRGGKCWVCVEGVGKVCPGDVFIIIGFCLRLTRLSMASDRYTDYIIE